MTEDQHPASPVSDEEIASAALGKACASGLLLIGVFLAIFCFGQSFEYGAQPKHAILIVVVLLVLAGVVAFFGLTHALKASQGRRNVLLLLICGCALSTRLIAVFTNPILEIDYYRYLWDGKVTAAGVSPYRYSPEQVLSSKATEDERLNQLKELALESESNFTILSRIHYEDHTTIYPPVSQAVLALSMRWFPASTSITFHIVTMKLVLVLFDIGTMLLVLMLLNKLNLNVAWLIVYAWNPLVIKEIANSAHLDSIAAFFLLASVALLIGWRSVRPGAKGAWYLWASAITLAVAVGAKLFPIILLPAMAVFVARQSLARGVVFSVVFVAASALLLAPMMYPLISTTEPAEELVSDARQATPGAVGFFARWRMNDTLFSCVYLNLKDSQREVGKTPWFVFTNPESRANFEKWFRTNISDATNPAFIVARVLTLGLFLVVYLWELWKLFSARFESSRFEGPDCLLLLRHMALVLTVFLLLQPTVNPWYFVWGMPLCCFCKNRGWLIASGVLLAYYVRFWLLGYTGQLTIGGVSYEGVAIYDHVMVWGVTIIAVGIICFFRPLETSGTDSGTDNLFVE